jgi:hypothetical protein
MKTFLRSGGLAALLCSTLRAAEPAATPASARPVEVSGIYPHLAMFNSQGECGTGAVVPWAGRLWVVTYSPHQPKGSDDKLYEITPDLRQIIRPESIGGTPANRFIHAESRQLFIGPYAIDAQGGVRTIPYSVMYGRPTGNARHLTDPANKIYAASMEEGFYEVDVHSLAVTELFRDEQLKDGRKADLPGYHGKGLYSGQGRLIYANNGEHGKEAQVRPDIPSGALAEWDGRSDRWTVVRRNQFTEVTGPGGLSGNPHPETDPVWSVGWDHRSLILQVLDHGTWHSFRLPKASHSYDGAHGWNTEWPRIRDIGEADLLMTMHGSFWRFPRTFDATHSAGILPRSNYLKIVGDFARLGDRIVLGCDDSAKSEFLNKRRVKGAAAGPGQSQSNLWFLAPGDLDRLGPALGRGAVWLDEAVAAGAASDAFLFAGFDQRLLHLRHDAGTAVTFTLEVDRAGDGRWSELRRVEVPASGYGWTSFASTEAGAWIRVRASRDVAHATAVFAYRNDDARGATADAVFAGLLRDGDRAGSGGLLHARGDGRKTLAFAATTLADGRPGPAAYYELDADLRLRPVDDAAALAWTREKVAVPRDVIGGDAASVVYTDEQGRRWRLPRAEEGFAAAGPLGAERIAREVVTERDLLNCGGSFFELPAENAGGVAKIRPVSSHRRRLQDFASYRGLLVLSGVSADAPAAGGHVVRSTDGAVALWVGAVDDLWRFGRPVGRGGPWKETSVAAGVASDPYLMTGYDRKALSLSHRADREVRVRVEVDLTGTGQWVTYATLAVPAGRTVEHVFPAGYQACWLRVSADAATTATAWLAYD